MPDWAGSYTVEKKSDVAALPKMDGWDLEELVRSIRDDGHDAYVWIPDWLADDEERDLEPLPRTNVFPGGVEDYSDDAWRLVQWHRKGEVDDPGAYLPKEWTIVVEPAEGAGIMKSSQTRLNDIDTTGT
jgi:hypothetical protein